MTFSGRAFSGGARVGADWAEQTGEEIRITHTRKLRRIAVNLDICKRFSSNGTALIETNKFSCGNFGAVERTRTSTPCGASTSS